MMPENNPSTTDGGVAVDGHTHTDRHAWLPAARSHPDTVIINNMLNSTLATRSPQP